MRLMNGAHTPELAEQTDKEIRDLRAAYNQTEAQLRAQSPRLCQPDFSPVVDSVALEKQNTTLVEFALGSEKSYAWVVSATSNRGI